jgi:multidrug resistance protein MdtO
MGTIAQSLPAPARPWTWFQELVKQELSPYPGRAGTVARMVIAATLVMIICMTFGIPYAFLGAIYALFISRESPRATLQSGGTTLLITVIGAAYILISVSFVIDVPTLHFFWIVGSFFLVFFALSTIANYGAASIFAVMIAVGVPIWDRHLPAYINVDDTLWLLLVALIGVAVTAAVELVFVGSRPGNEIVLPIAKRLAAVQGLLACYVEGPTPDPGTVNKITRYAMLGTSRLRRLLRRSDYSRQYRLQMSGLTVLVGRLVDIAATLPQLNFRPSSNDRRQLRDLAAVIAGIRSDLMRRETPGPVHFSPDDKAALGVPFLPEMETTVELISHAFESSRSVGEYRLQSDDTPQSQVLVPDALTNPEHFKFALKGCLAAILCYIIYNSINWPEISTAVVTCMLTALSTIGGSRQKQVLRLTGAMAGGFVLGMGSQIFILPCIDSITGFTMIFMIATGVSAWIMTSSPRLSYFGLQAALAFYLINLQEFKMQTSLLIARDRILGILLGLMMMWLVFDQLSGAPAAVGMKRAFISNLRSLARLAREPLPGKEEASRIDSLREMISAGLDNLRGLGDAVLFEFGPSRQRDLALRDRLRRNEPRLRMIFVTLTALQKYRFQLSGLELPEAVRLARQEFDNGLANTLDGIADRMEGKVSGPGENLEDSLERLEQTALAGHREASEEAQASPLQSFLTLSRRIEGLASTLDKEI